MVYGKNGEHGIRLNGFKPEVVSLENGNGTMEAGLLQHDPSSTELGYILSSMAYPEYPEPMGIFRQVERPTYTEGLMGQVRQAQASKGVGNLDALYRAADLWTVSRREEVEPAVAGIVSDELDDEYVDKLEGKSADKAQEPVSEIRDRLTTDTIAILNPNKPIEVDQFTSLAKAVRQMNTHNIGCVLVTDGEDRLVGILSESDVLNRVAGLVEDLAQAMVADYMTPSPVAVREDNSIAHALHLMSIHGFRHLPLVDEGQRPTGVISFRDVVHYLRENLN
jgi:CBS domain-containing protein